MKKIKLLKELTDKTLEKIIKDFGQGFGDLQQMNLSIWDVRVILYDKFNEISERVFKESILK